MWEKTALALSVFLISHSDCMHQHSSAGAWRRRLMERSEVALRFAFVSSSSLQQPTERAQFTEVHVALVEPLYTVGLIVDIVCHIFQILQVRPFQKTET